MYVLSVQCFNEVFVCVLIFKFNLLITFIIKMINYMTRFKDLG